MLRLDIRTFNTKSFSFIKVVPCILLRVNTRFRSVIEVREVRSVVYFLSRRIVPLTVVLFHPEGLSPLTVVLFH